MSTTASDHATGDFVEPSQQFSVDEVSLAWDRWGSGEQTELVLAHGFSGSAHDFSLLISELAADRPVLALDHRGHGRSTNLGRLDAYPIQRLVQDLVAFLEAQERGPVHLLGHSMGGWVVLGTVLARPDLVRSLILMDTSAWTFRPEPPKLAKAITDYMERFDPERGLPDPKNLRGPEDDLIEAATPAAWRARKEEMYAAMDPYAYKALGRQLFDEGLALGDRAGEITCPTTVLVGENDHPLIDVAPRLAEALPTSRLVEIAGAYHSPQLTHAEPWLAAVRGHLAWAEQA